MDVDDVLAAIAELPVGRRARLAKELGAEAALSDKQRLLAAEYCTDCDLKRAGVAAGYSYAGAVHAFRTPYVQAAIRRRLAAHEEACTLRAGYVREYIRAVLDFSPVDFLTVQGSELVVDLEAIRRMPPELKRLVESVELHCRGGRNFLRLNFVSKTAALGIAARVALVHKVQVAVSSVPWDAVAEPRAEDCDAIEGRLAGGGAALGARETDGGGAVAGQLADACAAGGAVSGEAEAEAGGSSEGGS
jgi:hypothetical protein